MKTRKLLFVGLLFALVLAACGGGDGAPVKMTKYDGSALSIEYPDGWKDSSMDMFGVTIGLFSPVELGEEALTAMDDPFALLGDDPLVLVMVLPAMMATDFNVDELDKELIPEEEGVEIVRQGDVDIDGVKGKEVVAKGAVEELGGKQMGLHVAGVEKDDGSVVIFMGMTPEKDLDENLDIFEYMIKHIKFK